MSAATSPRSTGRDAGAKPGAKPGSQPDVELGPEPPPSRASAALHALLATQVAACRAREPETTAIGFRVKPELLRSGNGSTPEVDAGTGGALAVEVGSQPWRIAWCASPLAARAALVESEESGTPLLLLTTCEERELGLDVLARLFRRRLLDLDAWGALRSRLQLRAIDPRLQGERWLPDHLLALDDDGLRPAGGVLEAEAVWKALLGRLGFVSERPDLRDLLAWCLDASGPGAFLRLDATVRGAYEQRLVGSAGRVARAVLERVRQGGGLDAIATGLVCELLKTGSADAQAAERAKALGRLETRFLAEQELSAGEVEAWAAAASRALTEAVAEGGPQPTAGRLAGDRLGPILEVAETRITELRLELFVGQSRWLPSGLAVRSQRLAAAIAAWLDHPHPPALATIESEARFWREHHGLLAASSEREGVEHLLRLVRFLAGPEKPVKDFEAAARRYLADGCFVDRARTALVDAALVDAELGAPFAELAGQLLGRVAERREEENRSFATALAQAVDGRPLGQGLVPVEAVLDEVVAPLAVLAPVLVLVLDGVSLAIADLIGEDLTRSGWGEQRPAGVAERSCAVALLPSITEVSRASLFTGERRRGDAAVEKQGFAEHPGLRPAVGAKPRLFHKANLDAGGVLAAPVKAAVVAAQPRVVGVVLNAVDDQLPRGGQLRARWQVANVRFLGELLAAATEGGRTLVLVGDHGHVVERDSRLVRHDGGGARFRPAKGAAGEGEIPLVGARVLAGDGAWVFAWSERLRYGTLQAGYHGGASPQEVLTALSVWAPEGRSLPGWEAASTPFPAWWSASAAPAELPAPAAEASKPRRGPRVQPGEAEQRTLFDRQAPAGDDELAALLSSPIYRQQARLTSRLGLDDRQVEAALRALGEAGGKLTLQALAHRLGMPVARVPGLVAALQRRLNVEGFAVLAVDAASDTLSLDRSLLRVQFGLESEG